MIDPGGGLIVLHRLFVAAGLALSIAVIIAGCQASTAAPTAQDAKQFLDEVDTTLNRLALDASRAGWVAQNFITVDTEAMDARATQAFSDASSRWAKQAVRFDNVEVPADQRRQLNLLKVSLVLATPSDPKESEELTNLVSSMRGVYGKGKWCPDPAKAESCMNIDDITKLLATSRNEKEIRAAWEGWHTISPPIKKDYQRFAELSNKGAKELGFADTGAMWRAKYDMAPDAFTKELDRLWDQVRPLYLQLHAYVRMKLHQKYGDVVPAERAAAGAPARQHLGPGLVERLRPRRSGQRRRRLLTDRHPQAPQDERDRHGQGRRALLLLDRPGTVATDLLGTIALPPPEGS